MCNGNCNQGRDCNCGPGSGMTFLIGAAVAYGIGIGATIMYIACKVLT